MKKPSFDNQELKNIGKSSGIIFNEKNLEKTEPQ